MSQQLAHRDHVPVSAVEFRQIVRHGTVEVLARLARGQDVDPSEYTFRTSTQIETAAADLDWMNRGIFISVAGRQAAAVIYETYLVG